MRQIRRRRRCCAATTFAPMPRACFLLRRCRSFFCAFQLPKRILPFYDVCRACRSSRRRCYERAATSVAVRPVLPATILRSTEGRYRHAVATPRHRLLYAAHSFSRRRSATPLSPVVCLIARHRLSYAWSIRQSRIVRCFAVMPSFYFSRIHASPSSYLPDRYVTGCSTESPPSAHHRRGFHRSATAFPHHHFAESPSRQQRLF